MMLADRLRALVRRHARKLTAAALLYLAVELGRIRRLYLLKRQLLLMRTPMSASFDAEKWGGFFVEAVRREASLGPERLRKFVGAAAQDRQPHQRHVLDDQGQRERARARRARPHGSRTVAHAEPESPQSPGSGTGAAGD